MGPFDRFNDRAKRVLALAQDEAIRLGHNYMGVEHLLLGLIREGEGVAARVLDSLGVDLSKTRTSVEFIVGRGGTERPTDITLSPRLKKVIELAIDEAKKLGHSHVGTEHLLLGMVREGGSVGTGVLESLGIGLEKIRHQVITTLAQAVPQASGPDVRVVEGHPRKRDWYCEDVLSGKLEVNVICQDDRVLAFHHPRPEFQLHAVVIPKRHVASLLAPDFLDRELLFSMAWAVQYVATQLGLVDRGFQVRTNAAAPGVTPHVHWHVIGPGLPPPAR